MSNNLNKKFIAEVLLALEDKKIRATKIYLHKFIYFLTLQNYVKQFKFQPYSYGPFSFNLASDIESMIFWDEVEDKNNIIHLIDDSYREISSNNSLDSIKKSIEEFNVLLDNNYNFDNIERVGTILYCIEVLKRQYSKIDINTVKSEFKGWKGDKYSDSLIENAFGRVISNLPESLKN